MSLDLSPLQQAVTRLKEGLARYERDISDTQIRDGLIQRFEFTYELSHKMLKRHLMTNHGLTTSDYRARWNLSGDYPLVAPNYAETRRELAKKIGLGRKPGIKRGRKPKA